MIKMPVVGVILNSIEAKRTGDFSKGVKINNKVTTTNLKEEEIPGISKSGVVIDFKFNSNYESDGKNVAEIIINGNVYYVGDDAKTIIKFWEKYKNIPEEPHVEILNTVFRKCITRAITISEDIQLPPPIGMPFAEKRNKKKD